MSVYIDKSLNSPRYNFNYNILKYMNTPEIYEAKLYVIKTLTHHIQDPWGNRENLTGPINQSGLADCTEH
jgi:hypothetical protein